MKAVYTQPGNELDYINTTDSVIETGSVIIFGTRAAVAACDIAPGETGTITLCGAFTVPKATGAITAGAEVYYDSSADNVTTTKTGNTLIGIAAYAAASADESVTIRLNG